MILMKNNIYICKKYDKYDIDKQKELKVSGDDAFARLYAALESNLDQALRVLLLSLSLSLFLILFSRVRRRRSPVFWYRVSD